MTGTCEDFQAMFAVELEIQCLRHVEKVHVELRVDDRDHVKRCHEAEDHASVIPPARGLRAHAVLCSEILHPSSPCACPRLLL